MKSIFLTFLTFLTLSSFGQSLKNYKVDENLTIRIPENCEIRDTLGQRIILAQIDNGLILISKTPNQGQIAVNIKNEKSLIDFYNGFQKGIIKTSNGELLKEEIIEINGLKLIKFSFQVTMGNERQIRYCLGLFLNENTYAIQFWELESMTNEMATERDQLFSSLIFPIKVGLKNQFSKAAEGSNFYNKGYLVGKLLGYMMVIGAIILLIVWIPKRVKNKHRRPTPV